MKSVFVCSIVLATLACSQAALYLIEVPDNSVPVVRLARSAQFGPGGFQGFGFPQQTSLNAANAAAGTQSFNNGPGGASANSANAAAQTQSFNSGGGGFPGGFPGFPGFGASGSSASAGASTQTLNSGFPGFGGGQSGSSANANAAVQTITV